MGCDASEKTSSSTMTAPPAMCTNVKSWSFEVRRMPKTLMATAGSGSGP